MFNNMFNNWGRRVFGQKKAAEVISAACAFVGAALFGDDFDFDLGDDALHEAHLGAEIADVFDVLL